MWMSPDPLSEEFSSWSPYSMCFDNPIKFKDPDGRAPDDWRINYTDKNGKAQEYVFNGGDGPLPDSQYVRDFVSAYRYDVGNGGGQSLKAIAENKNIMVDVQDGVMSKQEDSKNGGYNIVTWNSKTGLETTSGNILSPATVLEHEAGHALAGATNSNAKDLRAISTDTKYENKEERRVITGTEQTTARANGEIAFPQVTRTNHNGQPVMTTSPTSTTIDRQKTYIFLQNQNSQGTFFTGFGGEGTAKYKR